MAPARLSPTSAGGPVRTSPGNRRHPAGSRLIAPRPAKPRRASRVTETRHGYWLVPIVASEEPRPAGVSRATRIYREARGGSARELGGGGARREVDQYAAGRERRGRYWGRVPSAEEAQNSSPRGYVSTSRFEGRLKVPAPFPAVWEGACALASPPFLSA